MKKKWIFLTGILLLVLTAVWLYSLYQQPREKVMGKDADFMVTAVDLYNAFDHNESEANSKYVDKILMVSGVVNEIEESEEMVTIKLATNSESGTINAGMDQNKIEGIGTGNNITIKGRCTGYLTDVYLTDCIIENKKQ